MKSFIKKNLPWFMIFLLLWLGMRAWQQQGMAEGSLPVQTLLALNGEIIDLNQLPKPYLIHFTASWCPICQLQHETLQALSERWTVIQIITQSGDKEMTRRYAQTHNIPLHYAVADPNGQLLSLFGAQAVPADFFVGKNGQIQLHEMGYTSRLGYEIRLWWLR